MNQSRNRKQNEKDNEKDNEEENENENECRKQRRNKIVPMKLIKTHKFIQYYIKSADDNITKSRTNFKSIQYLAVYCAVCRKCKTSF